jgi:hypothetical protein
MAFLGALEHGIYVDDENDDECLGMSTSQIYEYFGIEQESNDDDEISTEEDDMHISADVAHEDSIMDDSEEYFDEDDSSAGEDEGMEDFSDEEFEQEQEVVCVYRHFMRKSFIKFFFRLLPLIIMRVVSTIHQSTSPSIHLHLKISLNNIKLSPKILKFWCREKFRPQVLVSFRRSGEMKVTHQ